MSEEVRVAITFFGEKIMIEKFYTGKAQQSDIFRCVRIPAGNFYNH